MQSRVRSPAEWVLQTCGAIAVGRGDASSVRGRCRRRHRSACVRAYTAIFPGGTGAYFDHDYYRDRHLAMMQRLYGAALTRVEARKTTIGGRRSAVPVRRDCQFLEFPNPKSSPKPARPMGRTWCGDKVHFTNRRAEGSERSRVRRDGRSCERDTSGKPMPDGTVSLRSGEPLRP